MSSQEWDREHLRHRVRSGADWFYWLAALSLGNSLWSFFNADVQFFFGLGVTMVADQMMAQGGSGWKLAGLGIGMFVSACFALGGYLARRNAFVYGVGVLLYTLDAALLVVVQAWLHVAVHAYVLYRLVNGFLAYRALARMAPEDPLVASAVPAATASPVNPAEP